jgi:excisionase family DNA binding protein
MAELNDRLFTAKEAGAYLGVSLSTLHKIEKNGLLMPFRTPGGHRRYDKKMLDDYLQSSRPANNHQAR